MNLFLEKDHRKKILKIGLPQEVADYLHQFDDKYSLWFADKIARMPEYAQARNKVQFVYNLQTQLQGILDWIRNTPNILIKNYTWDSAIAAAAEYHENIQISNLSDETNTILKKYDDGYYWVDLESTSDSCEASAMGHCANTNKGETLWSLRKYNNATQELEPFITISVSPDKNTWHQCKGKRNSKPKEEYWIYIADILYDNDIYKFVAEYDRGSDFGPKEFISTLESNEERFPDAEEYIEKIKISGVTVKDFEKVLKQYTWKTLSIELYDQYENDYIYPTFGFYMNIDDDETDLPIDCLELSTKASKDYFSRIFDVYVTDLEVESFEATENMKALTTIRGNIEESDGSFSLDETGLNSFKQTCRYYSEMDARIDKKEFLADHLEKLLVLDECLENPLMELKNLIGQDKIELIAKFSNDMSLLEVKFENFPIGVTGFIYPSIFIRDYYWSMESPKQIKPHCTPKTDNDYLLYSIFWNFIKNNVLNDPTQILYYDTTSFSIKKDYDWDDDHDIDAEEEFKKIQELSNKWSMIGKYLRAFERDIVQPFVDRKIPITADDLYTKKDGDYMTLYTNDDRYLGMLFGSSIEDKSAWLTKAKQHGYDYYYGELDENQVYDWLERNIEHQRSFRDFFEAFFINYK